LKPIVLLLAMIVVPNCATGQPSVIARLEKTLEHGQEEANLPLIIELLQGGEGIGTDSIHRMLIVEPAIEFAIVRLGRLGKKEHAGLLAPYLENPRGLRIQNLNQPYVNFTPQLRDLALAALLELQGADLTQHGFHHRKGEGYFFNDHRASVHLFDTVEERNLAFSCCMKNYMELGLAAAPRYVPESSERFLLVVGDVPTSLETSPNGKTRLSLEGNKARLVDVVTGQQVGNVLAADKRKEGQKREFFFTCYSFSPDGKYVVTGSGLVETFPDKDTRDTNIGRVQIWDATTGELVQSHPKILAIRGVKIGSVRAVGFSDGGKTIHFEAAKFSIDIS